MARNVRLQGEGHNYLWLIGEDGNQWLHEAWARRVQCNPGDKDLLIIHALCPQPANYLYPFPNGATLELLSQGGSGAPIHRGDLYDKRDVVVRFEECQLIRATQTNLNSGEDQLMVLRLYIHCRVQFDWQFEE